MKKKNILLVIGNGFDLELGLKSSYKSFIESDIYKQYSEVISKSLGYKNKFDLLYDVDINIFEHFKNILSIQNWIDLEMEIGKLAGRYMSRFNRDTGRQEKYLANSSDFMMSSYNLLRDCLNVYISIFIALIGLLLLSFEINFKQQFNNTSKKYIFCFAIIKKNSSSEFK